MKEFEDEWTAKWDGWKEEDDEAPVLETMIEEKEAGLKEQRDSEEEQTNTFVEGIKERGVPVYSFNADLDIERVFKRVLSVLRPYIELRNSMFERAQITDLRDRDVERYERSYLYEPSKYGLNSLFEIGNPEKSKDHSLIYRDKLFFFKNQEEKDVFKRTPDAFTSIPTCP